MSERISKINSIIASKLGEIIVHDHSHPSFGVIAVTRVSTSTDLKNCTVYVTSADEKESLPKYLNRLAPKIQYKLAQSILLKRLPKLYFKYDSMGDYMDRMEAIFKKIEINDDKNETD